MDIPNYTLASKIYEGPSTVLYRAFASEDHAPVVLKMPKNGRQSSREIARIRHEHAILRDLDVPGVVRARAIQPYDGGAALVLEDIAGVPLAELIHGEPLPADKVIRFALNLVPIVGELHRRGVIHKDIKPANILCDPSFNAVHLLDFGLATRLSQETQKAVSPDALEGTLAYMSPEQTGRMNRAVDYRTDFYSIGVTLYEMLTGAPPFEATSAMELVHSHIARTPIPPRERAPGVPRALSDIVMKLLAKTAEDRYQGTFGLLADLNACLRAIEAGATDVTFAVGESDISEVLRIPPKLYGRTKDIAALLAAFERAARGAVELLLVAGPSGIGKSALAHEIQKSIAQQGGYFIAGKFDQRSRSTPYAPIVEAFRELCRQILTERAEALAQWKSAIADAVGANGSLLTELIPELELLLGALPEVPPLGPTEAQNRFHLVFQDFVRLFAAPTHPLVLFLDDLQWADAGSLKLMQLALTDPERGHLLIIGAYRDGEVGPAHPLTATVDELKRSGAALSEMKLAPLSLLDVTEMVADTLSCGEDKAEPLARVVHEKTGGNPFFLSQLLVKLGAEGLIHFDATSGAFAWDEEAIQRHTAGDHLVELLAARIRSLSPASIEILKLASCIGHQFDLHTLERVSELSPREAAARLWEALREGMVVPLDADYRFVHEPEPGAEGSPVSMDLNVAYRFQHDRVQQAAYALIEDHKKPAIHLCIGKLLRASITAGEASAGAGDGAGTGDGANAKTNAEEAAPDEELFRVVEHMNLGAALITAEDERIDLARLNLAAGRRAKAQAAYDAAATYLAAGIDVLGAESFDRTPDLAFELHAEKAECEYLRGSFERAEPLFELLLARARTRREKARVHAVRVYLYFSQGRAHEAVEEGRVAVRLFGVEIPQEEATIREALGEELAKIPGNLGERRVPDLIYAPRMDDADTQASLRLMVSMCAAAYVVSPSLLALVAAKQVNLSLAHGHCEDSSYGYAAYAVVLAGVLERYEEAHQFGRLALDLNERFANADLSAKLHEIFGALIAPYRKPLDTCLTFLSRGREAGLASGDFSYASYTCFNAVSIKIGFRDRLSSVEEEIEGFFSLMQRTKDTLSTAMLTVAQKYVAALTGRTLRKHTLSDATFKETAYVDAMDKAGLTLVSCFCYTLRLELAYLYGEHAFALAMAEEAEKRAGSALAQYFTTDLCFFTALALIALAKGAAPSARAPYLAALEPKRAALAVWAESSPDSFMHKHYLVEAELAGAAGREADALALYDRAIEGARISEFLRDEALAAELCARYHLSLGRRRIAGYCMAAAHAGYIRWGATAKAADLVERDPHELLRTDPIAEAPVSFAPPSESFTSFDPNEITQSIGAGRLDVGTVLRAAHAIAGEILLDKALEQVMRIVVVSAGAQKGFLILDQDGRLIVEASLAVEPEVVEVRIGTPVEESPGVPSAVVHYVARTREAVVLADAAADTKFADDPHIAAHKPRSVLCLPLLHRGRLSGVLYLEHGASDVFTADRIELLRLLSTQAAIAVENALLYDRIHLVTEEIRRSNEELGEANDRLTAELEERARAEAERTALHETIINVQKGRLRELSTPIIPLTAGVLVMPLIGTMDDERAHQVLETALKGASAHRAKVVIFDITGMKDVGASAAGVLVRARGALRMLGAKTLLTGIRPEAAAALVELGVDMRGVTTRGTLESAVAWALASAR